MKHKRYGLINWSDIVATIYHRKSVFTLNDCWTFLNNTTYTCKTLVLNSREAKKKRVYLGVTGSWTWLAKIKLCFVDLITVLVHSLWNYNVFLSTMELSFHGHSIERSSLLAGWNICRSCIPSVSTTLPLMAKEKKKVFYFQQHSAPLR